MQLDQQQSAAVKTDSRKVLVTACPGAGKTRIIVERAARLIEECKTSPFELCLLTFTRLAAGEMRKRLEDRIGSQAHNITISTFHALALNLLNRFGDIIGFNKAHSTVYGDFEEKYLLKEIAIEMGLHSGKTWRKIKKYQIDEAFYKYYSEGIEPDQDHPAYDIFKVFVARCRENNSFVYGSLLVGLKMLLPNIKQYLNWKHIICDESHDNSKLQWQLLEMMQELLNASLYIVADSDQSIYAWRGGDPEYLIHNQDKFDIFKMETNYRSREPIVTMANTLIRNNEMRLPLEMKAVRTSEGPSWLNPVISVVKNMDSEEIANKINRAYKDNLNTLKNTAVLCRIHGPLGKLSQLLDDQDIKHNYVGKKSKLTNSEEFRRFHSFLKLIVNPYDNFSFLLIRELIGLSRADYASIRLIAARAGKSHFQTYQQSKRIIGSDFATLCQPATIQPGSFQDTVLNIQSILEDSHDPEFDCSQIVEFCLENDQGDVQSYLDWLATYDLQDEIKEENEGLQLLSIHAAKGLEFSTVIIAGVNEGMLPNKQAIKNDEIESERRLAYVAWTRAENQLILTVRPEQSEFNGKITNSPISRFIGESGI